MTTSSAGINDVSMIESSENSGFFESFDLIGESQIELIAQAVGDNKVVFTYGDESRDMIVTYNDATIDITDGNGGDWIATEVATVTINDPDQNMNPLDTDELLIADETDSVPTIIMGSPLTLATGANPQLGGTAGIAGNDAGVIVGHDAGSEKYTVHVANTTDISERLRITHSAEDDGIGETTHTWINVTTGHSRADLVALPGTVVLSYNIEGPADLVSSTGIDVYVTDDGNNDTDHAGGLITIVGDGSGTGGNVKAGVYDPVSYTHLRAHET